jgi:hypothetical protein
MPVIADGILVDEYLRMDEDTIIESVRMVCQGDDPGVCQGEY